MRTLNLALALLLLAAAPVPAQHHGSINDDYVDPDLDLQRMIDRFETETREVYAQRREIVAAAGIAPGHVVADVGAGTGAFLPELVAAVGPDGHVYTCEVSIRFVERLRRLADAAGWPNVTSVFSSFASATLPAASCDRIVAINTYHHFDDHEAMLASMRAALKPGGELFLVEFDRRPDSRAWIRGHVRADKATFRAEIEAAGFAFVQEVPVAGLAENFVHRYRRP